jgi:hypothetical protein
MRSNSALDMLPSEWAAAALRVPHLKIVPVDPD